MTYLMLLALNLQCFTGHVHELSGYEIKPKFEIVKTHKASKRAIGKLVKVWSEKSEGQDTRILSIAYLEARLRPYVARGDRGSACGIFQIHARYSHPMFRRKKGFVGWEEKKYPKSIRQECRKLEKVSYSIDTMKKYLSIMDKRDLHPCHHNSGIYGKCNTWYKQRLDFVNTYLKLSKALCVQKKESEMAMMKTGNPTSATPIQMIQGYLDSMADKPKQSEDEVYVSGYNLAESVKKGEKEAPAWAV